MHNLTPFWHQESYKNFMQEQLPALLAARMPLAGYQANATGPQSWQVSVAVTAASGAAVEAQYHDLPAPNADGLFLIEDTVRTVVPLASHSDLDSAEIKCVGELLLEFVEARLGQAAPDLPWDAALLRAWLPLDRWLADFMQKSIYAQVLDQTNWLASRSHPRRLLIANPNQLTTPGQFGRVCPFEMPEGPNLGRIFSIARGAAIGNGHLDIVENAPTDALGLSASMIPCLAHDDPNRLLMGANMMRQWLPFAEPEPALVQTGCEPAAADFWCGRNLLTAFLPWGADTYEEGIVLSESAARRLSNPHRGTAWVGDTYRVIEAGDKLSNRHGEKGVVSRILPDAQMPRRADGTPVELIFTSMSLPNRLNIGQLVELLLGRIAHAEGTPVIAPPFAGPSEAEIRQRLAAVSQPDDGMETLHLPAEQAGATGEPLAHPSAVGWLYWGVTNHLAKDKIAATTDGTAYQQRQARMEYQALKEAGAREIIREHFNTRAAGRYPNLAERVAAGDVAQAGPPTPRFDLLSRRLAAAGIEVTLDSERLHFAFQEPAQGALKLAKPVPHPWLQERMLETLVPLAAAPEPSVHGVHGAPVAEYKAVVALNTKLQRLLDGRGPQSLIDPLYAQLQNAVARYLNALVQAEDVRFDSRVCFSGRSVIAPGPHLRYDQVGLPSEMAWTLFGPLAARALGDADAVTQQTAAAVQALDNVLARSWLILNRAPSVTPETMLAFRPVRISDRAIRLHPLACPLLNADFDGDQVAVFLPVTAAGQQEAGQRLSLAGHLARNPALLEQLAPSKEAMWGLAWHSLRPAGLQEIEAIIHAKVATPDGFVTRPALCQILAQQLTQMGAESVLETLAALLDCGFAAIKKSGLSMSAFTNPGFEWPPIENEQPASQDAHQTGVQHSDQTTQMLAQFVEKLLTVTDYGARDGGVRDGGVRDGGLRDEGAEYGDTGYGPYVLAVRSGAVSEAPVRLFPAIIGLPRPRSDVRGNLVTIQHGFRQGLTIDEFYVLAPGARDGLAYYAQQWEQPTLVGADQGGNKNFHVLARARRAAHPGIVFARAAAIGEVDPLLDEDSRLFVGI